MRKLELACGVALSTLVLTGLSNNAFAAATLQCTQLAGIVFDPNIKSIASALSGSGATQFCNVNINWGRSADENIHIVVGLPNNSRDGGAGGIEGRWNGRTQGIGGGGCSGNLGVTSATNAGYVGSGTDGGHSGGDCEPGVNLDGTYNVTFIDDWSRVGLSKRFYSRSHLPTPITGCGPCTIIGTAARRVAAKVICSGKSWPVSSMASWRVPRRFTGHGSRQRRCGASLL